jgi:hypothetical protein
MTSEVLISSGLCCPLSTNAHKAERKTGTVRGRAKVRKGKSRIIEKESNNELLSFFYSVLKAIKGDSSGIKAQQV